MVSESITWLGHATVVIDLDGERIVTDPVLRRRVVHLRRDRAAPAPEGATGVLLSHLHYDHLDLPSLRRFARELPVVVPRGGAGLLRGFTDIREIEPGESIRLGRLQIDAVEAVHDGRRHPGGAHGPALGYVIRGSRSVYFAGDTDLFAGMAAFAPLDVALLPVGRLGEEARPRAISTRNARRRRWRSCARRSRSRSTGAPTGQGGERASRPPRPRRSRVQPLSSRRRSTSGSCRSRASCPWSDHPDGVMPRGVALRRITSNPP